MLRGRKSVVYAAILIVMLAVAAVMWRNQLNPPKPPPTEAGFVSGWFACKAYPGWLCMEDGRMKEDPNWIGPRADPKARKAPPPPGPER